MFNLIGLLAFVLVVVVLVFRDRSTDFLGYLCLLGLGCVITLSTRKGFVSAPSWQGFRPKGAPEVSQAGGGDRNLRADKLSAIVLSVISVTLLDGTGGPVFAAGGTGKPKRYDGTWSVEVITDREGHLRPCLPVRNRDREWSGPLRRRQRLHRVRGCPAERSRPGRDLSWQ